MAMSDLSVAFMPASAADQADRSNIIWYRQPAKNGLGTRDRERALGRNDLRRDRSERIQINEDTVWAGEKRNRSNPQGARNIAEVRRLLFAGKLKEAEALAEKTIISIPKRLPPYQPLGDLWFLLLRS